MNEIEMMQNNRKRTLPLEAEAAILCFLVAAVAIVPVMLRNAGVFALSCDFIEQQVPFGMLMNDAIKSGTLWSWGIDLGGNLLECFAFYNIASPFFLITLPFPAEVYPKLVGWVLILKFAVSGATSSSWMKRHLSRREAVLIGALLYSFSGAQCINVIFHFQDVMAFFPLMLIGMEQLVEEGKRGRFAAACALNLLCNPVFFFASALFCVLWFICSYAFPFRDFRRILRLTFRCLTEGLVAALMGAVIAVPTVINMLGNARATSVLPVSKWFTLPLSDYVIRVMAFFLPAESMNFYSVFSAINWTSWGAYLPLFGMVFVLSYIFQKRDSFFRAIVCCLLMAFIPILNSSFLAFSPDKYGRWLFMLDILLACVSAKICEDVEPYRKNIVRFSVLTLYLMPLIAVLSIADINRIGKFGYSIGIAVCSALFFLPLSQEKRKYSLRTYMLGTLLMSTVLFCVSIADYYVGKSNDSKINPNNSPNGSAESAAVFLTEVPSELSGDIGAYRYYFNEYPVALKGTIRYSVYNLGMTNSLPTINSFTTTCNNSITEFYAALGQTRTVMTPAISDEVNELLSARYILNLEPDEEFSVLQTFTNRNGQTFYLQEDPKAIPIGGLLYTGYITASEYSALAEEIIDDTEKDGSEKKNATPEESELLASILARCMVVKDEDVSSLPESLRHLRASEELAKGEIHYTDVEDFSIGKNSFETRLSSDAEGCAFFSVPYDRFWQCTVNGESVQILSVNGLMAVPVTEGENHVQFVYRYTPLRTALGCTVVGFLLWAGLLVRGRKKRDSAEVQR